MAPSHQPARANRSTCCKDSFWVVEVPDKSVDVHPGAGKARFALEGFKIEDYHDLVNALADGPSVDADLSFDCRRSDGIQTRSSATRTHWSDLLKVCANPGQDCVVRIRPGRAFCRATTPASARCD